MVVTRLSADARRQVFEFAAEEARRRGSNRLGTDHLLLGLLSLPDPAVVTAVGVGLDAARAAYDGLDRAALAAIGIDVGAADLSLRTRPKRRPSITSGARSVVVAAVRDARASKSRYIQSRHLLRALLTRQRPDPAAELLHALGIDRAAALRRLAEIDG